MMIQRTLLCILGIACHSYSFSLPPREVGNQFCRDFPSVSQLQAAKQGASSSLPEKVLVIGGTSGIGQLVTEKLASSGVQVCVTTRSVQRAKEVFTLKTSNVQFQELDLLALQDDALARALNGVAAVVISVGTTAFPTMKWKGGNTPKAVDDIAVATIARALSKQDSVKKVVLVTSVGVKRTGEMPFVILNLFGVLNAKRAGEEAIKSSGKSYCIVRPGRLVGGPFTNLDVAKLLQIQGGADNGVDVETGDSLLGDCKRDACAECIVQCLSNPRASNIDFSIVSNNKPALSADQWDKVFHRLAQ
jgi:uncharacterized protein YbjT (DUF2867 family)